MLNQRCGQANKYLDMFREVLAKKLDKDRAFCCLVGSNTKKTLATYCTPTSSSLVELIGDMISA